MQRHGTAPSVDLLQTLLEKDRGRQGARSGGLRCQHPGRQRDARWQQPGLRDADPMVQRAAAEALVRMGMAAESAELRARRGHLRAGSRARTGSSAMPGGLALEDTRADPSGRARVLRREQRHHRPPRVCSALINTKTSEADIKKRPSQWLVVLMRRDEPDARPEVAGASHVRDRRHRKVSGQRQCRGMKKQVADNP